MIPGTELVHDKADMIDLIKARRNPDGLPPLEVLRKAIPVGREVFDGDFFAGNETFYVLYEHPILENRNKLYLVGKQDLLPFLQAAIKPERGEGLDITVVRQEDMKDFLICNHDGEMYLLSVPIGSPGCRSVTGRPSPP